jgi:hypothetical protein
MHVVIPHSRSIYIGQDYIWGGDLSLVGNQPQPHNCLLSISPTFSIQYIGDSTDYGLVADQAKVLDA